MTYHRIEHAGWRLARLLGLASAAALVLCAGTARALEAPHNETANPPIDCASCHAPHGPDPILPRGAAQEALCKSCHNPTGQAAALSDVANHDIGNGQVIDCGSCHNPHGPQQSTDPHPGGVTAPNLVLIRADTAKYVPGALQPAVFQDRSRHFAFDAASAPWNGICQTCHQNTSVHTNDASGGHDHAVAAECTGCHQHGTGFKPVGGCTICHEAGNTTDAVDPVTTNGSGTAGKHVRHVAELGFECYECHDQYLGTATHANGTLDSKSTVTIVKFDATNPAGTWSGSTCSSMACHGSSVMQWYADQSWTVPDCGECHDATVGTRRPVLGSAGDFATNPAVKSHHVAGAADPSADQCRVCHDMSSHMFGTVALRAPDGGDALEFTPGDADALEPFCLGCHDGDGAAASFAAGGSPLSPFADLATLGLPPYPYANKIATSWAKDYGHASLDRDPSDRLTCAGSGAPGTGCHGSQAKINAHGSTSEVLAAKNYRYSASARLYDETWFSLCFDCHSNYPGVTKEDVLGVKEGGRLDEPYGYLYRNNTDAVNDRRRPPYYTAGVTTRFADHNEVAISVGASPRGVLYAAGDLWVVNTFDNNVQRIDPATGLVLATISLGAGAGPAGGITSDGSHVWITQNNDWKLAKISVSDNTKTTLPAGDPFPHGVVHAAGYLWVTTRDKVIKIDAVTNVQVAAIPFVGLRPEGIAYDGTHVWATHLPNQLVKIDPASATVVASVTVGSNPYNVVAGAGFIWVTNINDDTVSKVDPATNTELTAIAVGDAPYGILYDGTSIWAANAASNNVSKIDVAAEITVATVPLTGTGAGVAYDNSYVWVTVSSDGSLAQIDPVTATATNDPHGMNDPPTHTSGTKSDMNLHWYHLRFFTNFRGNKVPKSPWVRGALCDNCHRSDADDINVTCVNCHNVHGSDSARSALYDELGYTSTAGPWGEYGELPATLFLPTSDPNYLNLDKFPTYCANNCHNATGSGLNIDLKQPRRAWFDPIVE